MNDIMTKMAGGKTGERTGGSNQSSVISKAPPWVGEWVRLWRDRRRAVSNRQIGAAGNTLGVFGI